MGWRDFQIPILVEKMEKMEKTLVDAEQIPFITFIPPKGDPESKDYSPINRLTKSGKEAFKLYVGEMLYPEHGPKLTLEAAHNLAMELVSCFPGNLRQNIKE